MSVKLKLRNPETNKEQVFTQELITARDVRRGLELQVELEKDEKNNLELLDLAVDFTAAVFKNKVTEDMILDGLAGDKVWGVLGEVLKTVINGGNPVEDAGKKEKQ
ncbi:phage tail assembly chaperone G [Listeria ilorinensis]|uniref:phage tail assembly chaperone G n=1 Tax=Listeria ilorinensis TaxID=2867439 RepID=UPI001EF4E043|nr:hypothetical protein [Listeria ilorinensis]